MLESAKGRGGGVVQDVQGQFQPLFWLLYGWASDPIFLLILCAGFLLGLSAAWTTGIFIVVFLTAFRVSIIDWQDFVPGVEPSETLADIFLFTIVASLLAFATGKFCRVLVILPKRTRR
jgi:hypothetical protein